MHKDYTLTHNEPEPDDDFTRFPPPPSHPPPPMWDVLTSVTPRPFIFLAAFLRVHVWSKTLPDRSERGPVRDHLHFVLYRGAQ
ncbi:hypothetical protein ACOMHN_039742 [Nucella lapillus]